MGSSTKNDLRFLRWFWEVPLGRDRWKRFTKGGRYQRWFGLETHCVDWELAGIRPKTSVLERYPYLNGNYGWVIKYEEFHLQPGITYTNMARGSLGCRMMDRAIPGHSSHAIFPCSGAREAWLALLNSHLSSTLLRIITQSLTFETGYVARLPVVDPHTLESLGRLAVEEKAAVVCLDPLEWSFDYRSYVSLPGTTLGDIADGFLNASELHALNLLLMEGEIERQVWGLYGLDEASKDFVLSETGAPVALFPTAPEYSGFPSTVAKGLMRSDLPRATGQNTEQLMQQLIDVLLRANEPRDVEDRAREDGEDDATLAEGANGRPIPSESHLEELSAALELNPISVYWMVRELRDKEGIVFKPAVARFVEGFMSILVLRLLGHRWPREIVSGEPAPAWANLDGIVPITWARDEPALLSRVRDRIAEKFGLDRVATIEQEFRDIVGITLEAWLTDEFFTRHISKFRKRPIAWQLRSSDMRGYGKGGKRVAGRRNPIFSCLVYYHCVDADLLPKLRTHYIGPLLRGFQTELSDLEKVKTRTAEQDARRLELVEWIDELKAFDGKLEEVSLQGFGCAAIEKIARAEKLDKWTSRDGGLPAPATPEAFLAQESRYAPDLNDGVRVNLAPLQRAGLLAADVLNAKEVERAIADRAEWRADERRWCREGKLLQPGWWLETAARGHSREW